MLRLLSRVSFGVRNLRKFSVQPVSVNSTADDVNKKRQILELELDLLRQDGKKVPSRLKEVEWERLLDLPSISARRKYYSFLFNCEMSNQNLKKKKEERAMAREEKLAIMRENEADQHIVYGLGKNSIFLKIYETTMNLWNNNKLVQAIQFGSKIVIDCSYDEYMTQLEADNCAKQLTLTFAINRLHDQPFDIHFCNFDTNSRSGKRIVKQIPTILNPEFPVNVHSKSYLDIFDKERLVYLTPHCRQEMVDYNPDDVYIVGAMVDKAHSEPISLAKAKKYGLRMAKFPLDRYFQFQGGKCLTLNQVIEIMLEMKVSNDWKKALVKSIPKRKIGAELDNLDFDERINRRNDFKTFNRPRDQSRERSHFDRFTKNINTYNKRK